MQAPIVQSRRRQVGRARVVLLVALVVCGMVLGWRLLSDRQAAPEAKGTLHATPATLEHVFASAAGGATILLAPGDYRSFAGGAKARTVTIRPQGQGAARMSLAFAGVANLRIEGLTIDGAQIGGRSHDVVIAGSRFTKAVVIHAEQMTNANVVLDGNRLARIDVCAKCLEGRVHVIGDSGHPSGVVIRNNILGPGGNADGIQVSANGVQVLGNTFVGIHERAGDLAHTDALQLYGQRDTVVRGNYFRDVSTAIMAPDGGHHELIEDNVFDTSGYPYAILLGGDDGSVIRHNTLPDFGGCAWNLPCGSLLIGADHAQKPSRGTVVEDNILGQLSLADGSTLRAQSHNLIAADGAGPSDITGKPVFVGGAHPTSRDRFRLAGGSPGTKAASDGTDAGIGVGR